MQCNFPISAKCLTPAEFQFPSISKRFFGVSGRWVRESGWRFHIVFRSPINIRLPSEERTSCSICSKMSMLFDLVWQLLHWFSCGCAQQKNKNKNSVLFIIYASVHATFVSVSSSVIPRTEISLYTMIIQSEQFTQCMCCVCVCSQIYYLYIYIYISIVICTLKGSNNDQTQLSCIIRRMFESNLCFNKILYQTIVLISK